MQINPFGFPLGAGTQAAPAIGGTGLGFADALGLAVQGDAAPAPVGLIASTTIPRNFTAKLSQTLAQAQFDAQPMPTAAALPGLQQPTSLSQLMATAAKLPAEQGPIADPLVPAMVAQPEVAESAVAKPLVAQPKVAVEADPAAPEPVATPVDAAPAAPVTKPVPAPVVAPADAAPVALPTEVEAEAEPETPSVEAAPAKPQKRVRTTLVEADPAQPAEVNPAAPAPALSAAVVPQPVAAQPQPAPRDGAAPQIGNAAAPAKKAAAAPAASEGAPQGTTGTGTDFSDAVAAQGGKSSADANADGQAQPEFVPGTAVKHDAAAPVATHAAHNASAADTVRAPAPAAPVPHTESVIDARSHLGHSLGVEIARKVELGEETLRIRLNPIELGRIEVTLAFDDKGSLQATVRAESPQAMDLLRQDAGDLARTLDQAGVRTDAQSFRFENRGGDSGGQQAQQQQSANRGQFASSDDDATLAEPIYRPVRSDGQVDLLA